MDEDEVRVELQDVGAVITDSHVVYTSGKHGSAYVNKDAIYPHTLLTCRLCRELARHFLHDAVQVVIAPAVGGVILSQWVAYHLTEDGFRQTGIETDVLGVYAEKSPDDGSFVITRGYDALVRDRRVLVVEDVLTTGGSVRKVVEAVRANGGEVVGVGALCNRGGVTKHDLGDVPQLAALLNVRLDAWDAAACPLCARGVPINTAVGKGREFLARGAI